MAMGCLEKGGPFLLYSLFDPLWSVHRPHSPLRLPVSLLLVCLSLALFSPLAPTALAWAEP